MDKESLKKRIFAEGAKAKGGVNRFLEEKVEEKVEEEVPQSFSEEPVQAESFVKENKNRNYRILKRRRARKEAISNKAWEEKGKTHSGSKLLSLKKRRKLLHAFVIPCYGESSYLEECIQSLLKQKNPSPIYLCTATPNAFLKRISKEYRLPLFVRNGEPSLARDWNFALEIGRKRAKLVTLAHQDDLYLEDYSKAVEHAYSLYPDASLIFTKARDIDGMGQHLSGIAEGIKRLLRLPYHFPHYTERSTWKKLPLLFGNSIPCPSCTYVTERCGKLLFKNRFRFITDWDAFLHLAEKEGRFLYIKKTLLSYRRHEDAETRKQMKNKNRLMEEKEQFQKLHGKFLGSLLAKAYSLSGKWA